MILARRQSADFELRRVRSVPRLSITKMIFVKRVIHCDRLFLGESGAGKFEVQALVITDHVETRPQAVAGNHCHCVVFSR